MEEAFALVRASDATMPRAINLISGPVAHRRHRADDRARRARAVPRAHPARRLNRCVRACGRSSRSRSSSSHRCRTLRGQEIATYRGPCDASAGIALDGEHFVVANDENNTLNLYRRGQPASVGGLDLAEFLRIAKGKEADIEGAAPVGNRLYWITSHGRNSKGNAQPNRQRFFATQWSAGALTAIGKPYSDLLRDLTESPALKRYDLQEASRRAAEAPGGLNIEGLAATPDGGVLIGFRNPLFGGRALIVPLDNPADVVDGKRAKLGPPIELDLGGRGIRSIDLVGSSYLIVGGPIADDGTFALFRWSGKRGEPALPIPVDLQDLRPEGLFAIPQTAAIQLLSDDGGITIDGFECKALPPARQAVPQPDHDALSEG